MKKILISSFLVIVVIVFSGYTNKLNNKSPKYQGLSGTVTYNGNAVASKSVYISKPGFSITKITDNNGYYEVDDSELAGTGIYSVVVSYCQGVYWYHGSASVYYNGNSASANVALTSVKNGCPDNQ